MDYREQYFELADRINKALDFMKYESKLDREKMFLLEEILKGDDWNNHITFID